MFASFDTETWKFRPGIPAPKIVCSSQAKIVEGKIHGALIVGRRNSAATFAELLKSQSKIFFANAAYDLCVIAQEQSDLLSEIFAAIESGRIFDISIAQALDAIYRGLLGIDPRTGSELRNPATGKVTTAYGLAVCADLVLGRTDSKRHDTWRTSYGLLDGIPVEAWPFEARQYPVDDAEGTLEIGVVQISGRPGDHAWIDVPGLPGYPPAAICSQCGLDSQTAKPGVCDKAPRIGPHMNLDNLPAQVAADFAFKLGAAHSFRVDPERVERLAVEVEAKHAKAVERFQKKGWIRADGSEDEGAIKKAVALAYGAGGVCRRCRGGVECRKCSGAGCDHCGGLGRHLGKVLAYKTELCRGEKAGRKYQGCKFVSLEGDCRVCGNLGEVRRVTGEKLCRHVYEGEVLVEEGCDGTGLDLATAPFLPRTDKNGVSTERDTKMESGDEDLADYGADEHEKSRTTYLPYLRTGIEAPLGYSPNVIVATGRGSIQGSPLHQMPRKGLERQCIRARGAWCGYPIETVLGSTDYEAGELCTLSTLTYWLFGYSRMREAIERSGKPGVLHSDLASEVLGISLDEFLQRLKNKDKQAADFRQCSKPNSFGIPGGMGTPKIVATARKKNAGFTVCEGGAARDEKDNEGYWGVRFCVLTGGAKRCGSEKILEWKHRPVKYPVCRTCCEIVEHVFRPAYFRKYPEVRDYFNWVQGRIDRKEPAPVAIWDEEAQRPRIIRERGGCDFPAYCNNGFQAMLSDIGKHAFVKATKECYLGVKEDGSPSPLAGCRLPIYLHDEPLSELILSTAHLSGPRIAEIMVESGRKLAPGVWKAETALSFWWDKNMEPVYREGKLVPWGPVPEYLSSQASI